MKTTYTLTNYNAVFEDPDWIENARLAQAASLTDLVWNTFDGLLQTDALGGLTMDFEEEGNVEPPEEEECDTRDGSYITEDDSEEKKEDE